MVHCTIDKSRARKDAMLPSTISWVCHQGITMNEAEGQAVSALPSLQDLHGILKTQKSGILQNHQLFLAEDRVWLGVIRHTPTSHETTPVQPLVLSSSSSSLSPLDEDDEVGGGQHTRLLGQACEIMISSIRNDDCGTPKTVREKMDLQAKERIDAYKAKQYRQELLTDDLRMFQEQLQLSRCRNRAPSMMDRKLRLYRS